MGIIAYPFSRVNVFWQFLVLSAIESFPIFRQGEGDNRRQNGDRKPRSFNNNRRADRKAEEGNK
jgi:hypothetical protein